MTITEKYRTWLIEQEEQVDEIWKPAAVGVASAALGAAVVGHSLNQQASHENLRKVMSHVHHNMMIPSERDNPNAKDRPSVEQMNQAIRDMNNGSHKFWAKHSMFGGKKKGYREVTFHITQGTKEDPNPRMQINHLSR